MVTEVGAGTLLIAGPGLTDPNFQRSVVLLCDHNDEGSLGLVINRPLRTPLRDVFPELLGESAAAESLLSDADLLPDVDPGADTESDAALGGYIFAGGPVETNRVMAIRQSGTGHDSDHVLFDEASLVVAVDDLVSEMLASSSTGEGFRFFVGYAGWGKDQLAGELEEGAWITRPATNSIVFEIPPAKVWSEALRELGGEFKMLAEMPLDPELN